MIPPYSIHQLAWLRSFRPEEERLASPTPAGKARPVPHHILAECKIMVLSTKIGQNRFCFQGRLLQPGPKMAKRSLLLREIFFALLDIRLDGITARLPASWAHCKRKGTDNNRISGKLHPPKDNWMPQNQIWALKGFNIQVPGGLSSSQIIQPISTKLNMQVNPHCSPSYYT